MHICTYVSKCAPVVDAMFLSCSDDKTGNVFDEVPTHQKDALDEMFIYFSENEPESSSELPAQKDALDDMFFDYQEFEQSSLDPETSKRTSNDSRSQRVHRHKRNMSSYREQKLNPKFIQQQLSEAAHCCVKMCLAMLTWQTILTGRLQYVGLDSNEDRRKFLEVHNHLKLQSGARYRYVIPWKEGNDLTCCAKAWRFYYGISEWQHKRRSLKKSCKVSTQRFGKKHFNRRERMMIEWLKTYSSSVGCTLPFSKHAAPSPVIT